MIAEIESQQHKSNLQAKQNTERNVQLYQSSFLSSVHQLNILNIGSVYRGNHDEALIRYFNIAFDRTFVIRVFQRKLQHYSTSGQLLGNLDFANVQRLAYVSFMPTAKTVASICFSPLQDRRDQDIVLWDLQTYQTITIPFTRNLTSYAFECFFPDSNLWCAAEADGDYSRSHRVISKIIFKYYKFPLQKLQSKFQPLYETQLNIPNLTKMDLQFLKLNNKSLVGCFDKQLIKSKTNQIGIYLFDPCESNEWKMYSLTNSIESMELDTDWSVCSMKIVDMLEVRAKTLYIRIGFEPDKQKLGGRLEDDQNTLYNYQKQYDFVWEYKINKISKVNFGVQKCHFLQFVGQYRSLNTWVQQKQYISAGRQIRMKKMRSNDPRDYKYCKEDMKYYHWQRNQVNARMLDILYINPLSMQVMERQQKMFNIVTYYSRDPKWLRICPASYSNKILVQYSEQKKNNKIFIQVKKVRQLRQAIGIIAISLITQLIAQPDEDLLFNVVNLNCCEEGEDDWIWTNRDQNQQIQIQKGIISDF